MMSDIKEFFLSVFIPLVGGALIVNMLDINVYFYIIFGWAFLFLVVRWVTHRRGEFYPLKMWFGMYLLPTGFITGGLFLVRVFYFLVVEEWLSEECEIIRELERTIDGTFYCAAISWMDIQPITVLGIRI